MDEPLADAQRAAFVAVASRYRGQPLESEPVAAELVFAVVEHHFLGLPGFSAIGHALSARVARTLMEDPACCQRLGELWARLGGLVP